MTTLLPGAPYDTKAQSPRPQRPPWSPSLPAPGNRPSACLCPLLEPSFLISLKHAQIWLLVNYVNRRLCFKTTFYPLMSAETALDGTMETERLSRCHKTQLRRLQLFHPTGLSHRGCKCSREGARPAFGSWSLRHTPARPPSTPRPQPQQATLPPILRTCPAAGYPMADGISLPGQTTLPFKPQLRYRLTAPRSSDSSYGLSLPFLLFKRFLLGVFLLSLFQLPPGKKGLRGLFYLPQSTQH